MARRTFLAGPEPRGVLPAVRVFVAFGLTVGISFALLYSGYIGYTALAPVDVEVPEGETTVDETGRRVSWGRAYLARRGRLWHLHLAGTPEEIGAAHGYLAGRLFDLGRARVDERMLARHGTWIDRWAEMTLLRWDYRGADAGLTDADRRELAALAEALPHESDAELEPYHRLFLQQAVFDVTQRLQDVIVDGAMFAAAPEGSGGEAGNLIIGRTLTVDLGEDFDLDRVVSFYFPDGKYPFASVSWAGMTGVVTGINARGIFVAGNPARTDDPREEKARPLPLVLRQILEEADTLEQALDILDASDIRTASVVLVGDGVQRKSVVVEAAARRGEERRVVRGDDESTVWATDHMLREPFASDAQNDRIKRTTSSGYRFDRLSELLRGSGALDVEGAVTILRDRRGLQNAELGLGNRNALENLTTTHSVVVDATSMVLWVAEGPSTLGRYRAFDLRHILQRQGNRPAPLEDIPADRLLHSEEYNDYVEALAGIRYARRLRELGRLNEALSAAEVALALAPDIGQLHRLLGDIHRDLGEPDTAKEYYRRYLELVPGRLRDQERVRGIIEELGG